MDYKNQLALTGELNDVGAAKRVNIPKSYRMGIEFVGGAEIANGFDFNGTATFSFTEPLTEDHYLIGHFISFKPE